LGFGKRERRIRTIEIRKGIKNRVLQTKNGSDQRNEERKIEND
jgi:hypothetical protein